MGKWQSLVAMFLLATMWLHGQAKNDIFLQQLLTQYGDTTITKVLSNPQQYRYQIMYTKIDRSRRNKPHFTQYYLNVDPALYFYPASTVKLPLAALALEKTNTLKKYGIDVFTPISMDSIYTGLPALPYRLATGQYNTLAQLIKEVLLVSDNDAYNRLYQFLGQQYINRTLQAKGYKQAQVVKQFAYLTEQQNRHTTQVNFYDDNNQLLYSQAPQFNSDSIEVWPHAILGTAYVNRNNAILNEPMNFTRHNNISLQELQRILQAIMFPASLSKKQRFNLQAQQYAFLRQYLSQFPGETNNPAYDSTTYYNTFVKYFFRNGGKQLPPGIRVFNKVGWAYGTLTDVSYIVDFNHNLEYMLTATIYCNKDGILNDDIYDYEQVGLPFLYSIGQAVYNYEKTRYRKHIPKLNEFKLKYEVREPVVNPVKNVNN